MRVLFDRREDDAREPASDAGREQRNRDFTAGAIRSLHRRVTQLESEVRTLTTLVNRRPGETSTQEIPNGPDADTVGRR